MFVKRAVKKFLGKDYRLDLSARFAEYSEVLARAQKPPFALLYLPFRVLSDRGARVYNTLPPPLRCSTMASLPKQIFYRRALGDDSSKNLKETRCCRNRCKKRRRIKREFLFPVFQSLSPHPFPPLFTPSHLSCSDFAVQSARGKRQGEGK